MKIAIAILPNGMINSHMGRTKRVALAAIENGKIADWQEVDVPFGENHDHNHNHHDHHDDHHHHDHDHHHHDHHHHDAIGDFMVENGVDTVLVEHVGPGIQHVLNRAKVNVAVVNSMGKAKDIVQEYIQGIQ